MIKVNVIPSHGSECHVRGDIVLDVSSRILNKVNKTPGGSKHAGYLCNHGSEFDVRRDIHEVDVIAIIAEARKEVLDEISIEEMWDLHEELNEKFSALDVEKKKELLKSAGIKL